MTTGFLIVAICTIAFSMVAKRLTGTMVTAPMVFLGLGGLLSLTGLLPHHDAEGILHVVAEITLVVLLFFDAAQIDLKALQVRHAWPQRMLVVGLPLTIALGTLAAFPFLPGWPLVGVALVAAILAPTDAALGQAVVTNPTVPDRVRRALTVESGINDGLALPAVLLFASLTAEVMGNEQTNWLLFGAMQLALGPAVGIAVGLSGGATLLFAKDHDLTSDTFEGIGALALAGVAYLGADLVGGNGFIAAFVGGLCFGHLVAGRCKFIFEFTESEGQLLTWSAFFLLGLVLLPDALAHLTLSNLAIILISLFVVRPVAVWISLLGSDAAPATRLFFGWFGPRGLATALFALLILEKIPSELGEPVLALAINTVWISALLHGLSAAPAAKWYASIVSTMGKCPETLGTERSAKPLITFDD